MRTEVAHSNTLSKTLNLRAFHAKIAIGESPEPKQLPGFRWNAPFLGDCNVVWFQEHCTLVADIKLGKRRILKALEAS